MDFSGPVLLFDGECGLCVHCVRLLLKADRKKRLHFALLQGGAAQSYMKARGAPLADFDSVLFVSNWAERLEQNPLLRTDALFAVLREIGGGWRLVSGLQVFPPIWRDAGYRLAARWRRRFFGPGNLQALYVDFGLERFVASPDETPR